MVDDHTGRSPFFIIYDTDTEGFEAIDNWRVGECLHWAGPKAVALLARAGTRAMLVKRIGPSAFRRFGDAQIDVFYAGTVTVVDAIKLFRLGCLPRASAPNCRGHDHWRSHRGISR